MTTSSFEGILDQNAMKSRNEKMLNSLVKEAIGSGEAGAVQSLKTIDQNVMESKSE